MDILLVDLYISTIVEVITPSCDVKNIDVNGAQLAYLSSLDICSQTERRLVKVSRQRGQVKSPLPKPFLTFGSSSSDQVRTPKLTCPILSGKYISLLISTIVQHAFYAFLSRFFSYFSSLSGIVVYHCSLYLYVVCS